MDLLEDRTAVVTGGARGLGFAIAERFIAEGARVVIGDIDLDAAREQVEHLQALAREAVVELRSLVFELRPAELETEGLDKFEKSWEELLGSVRSELEKAGENK